MKNIFICVLQVLACWACSSPQQEDVIFVFDTSGSYPEKQIALMDVCDISYIPIDDAEVVSGRPRVVTDERIIFVNRDGDFLIFDREGHFLNRFNHRGGGPGEYPYVGKVIYDLASDHLIVTHDNRILTYTTMGDFVRGYTLDPHCFIWDIKDYTPEVLLINNSQSLSSAYLMIEKETGRMLDSISLTVDSPVLPYVQVESDGMRFSYSPAYYNLVKGSDDHFLLNNISADTFYVLDRNSNRKPYLVRQPSVQGQSDPIFVNAWIETGYGYFLSTVERKFDPESKDGFNQDYYVIEKGSQEIFRARMVHNEIEDYEIRLDPGLLERSANASWGVISLPAEELVEARDEGRIQSPRLAEIVREMAEDDNPVLMLLHFK